MQNAPLEYKDLPLEDKLKWLLSRSLHIDIQVFGLPNMFKVCTFIRWAVVWKIQFFLTKYSFWRLRVQFCDPAGWHVCNWSKDVFYHFLNQSRRMLEKKASSWESLRHNIFKALLWLTEQMNVPWYWESCQKTHNAHGADYHLSALQFLTANHFSHICCFICIQCLN